METARASVLGASLLAGAAVSAVGSVAVAAPASVTSGKYSSVTRCCTRTRTRRPAGSVVMYSIAYQSGIAVPVGAGPSSGTVPATTDGFCSGSAGEPATATETCSGFLRRRARNAWVLHSSLQYFACDRLASGMGLEQRAQIRTGSAYHAGPVRFGSRAAVNRNRALPLIAASG